MLCCSKSGVSGASVRESGSAVSACGLFLDANFFLVTEFLLRISRKQASGFALAKRRWDGHGSKNAKSFSCHFSCFALCMEHTQVRCNKAQQLAYHEQGECGGPVFGVGEQQKARKTYFFAGSDFILVLAVREITTTV